LVLWRENELKMHFGASFFAAKAYPDACSELLKAYDRWLPNLRPSWILEGTIDAFLVEVN
jgi:hypothetical protein